MYFLSLLQGEKLGHTLFFYLYSRWKARTCVLPQSRLSVALCSNPNSLVALCMYFLSLLQDEQLRHTFCHKATFQAALCSKPNSFSPWSSDKKITYMFCYKATLWKTWDICFATRQTSSRLVLKSELVFTLKVGTKNISVTF